MGGGGSGGPALHTVRPDRAKDACTRATDGPQTHKCVRTVRRQRRVRSRSRANNTRTRATKQAQNQTSDAQSQTTHTHRVTGGWTNRVKSGVRSGPAAPAHPGPRRVPAVNQTDAQTGTQPHHRHTRQVGKEKPRAQPRPLCPPPWGGGGLRPRQHGSAWAGPRRASGETEAAQKACLGKGRGLKLGAAGPTTDPREGDLLLPLCLPAPRMQAWRRGPRRVPCPGGAPGAAAFRTGRPLITPWLPEPWPRRAHAFSTSGQDGANPGTGASKSATPARGGRAQPWGRPGPRTAQREGGAGGGEGSVTRPTEGTRFQAPSGPVPLSPSPRGTCHEARPWRWLAVGSPARGRGKTSLSPISSAFQL